jgi:hypothetical protein
MHWFFYEYMFCCSIPSATKNMRCWRYWFLNACIFCCSDSFGTSSMSCWRHWYLNVHQRREHAPPSAWRTWDVVALWWRRGRGAGRCYPQLSCSCDFWFRSVAFDLLIWSNGPHSLFMWSVIFSSTFLFFLPFSGVPSVSSRGQKFQYPLRSFLLIVD